MEIEFTKHIVEDKIPILKKSGFKISRSILTDIIRSPEHLDKKSDRPRIIASKSIDEHHILRIVYKVQKNGIIKAITVYPAEKGRYY